MMVLTCQRAKGHPFASGLTLVELLVSMLLGLLLVAGMVSAYLSASRHYAYEEQMARMQENGRYAMRLLSREFAMAGFYGGMPSSVDIPAASVDTDCSAGDWALDARNPLDLVNDYAGQSLPVSQHLTAFSCLDRTAIAWNTDLVAIKRTAAEASMQRGIPAESLTSSTVAAWYLRVVSGVAPAWELLRPVDLRSPSRALPSMSYWEAISRIIFIRKYSEERGDGIPSLCMETLAGDALTARCLVEGVENLQVEFGIDTDEDGVPNRYIGAPTAAQLQNAVAVKIHLLLRSIGTLPGYRDAKTYRLGAAAVPATHDAYLRRVLSSTVLLRNHIAFTG
jgi:Tfp pilus assembly protein PilV